MPFQQIGLDRLDSVVNVRVTAHEKERLKADADIAGTSVSDLVRSRYFGKPIIAASDEAMRKELLRVAGLLKHIHNENLGMYSKETSEAIVELRKLFRKLSHDC